MTSVVTTSTPLRKTLRGSCGVPAGGAAGAAGGCGGFWASIPTLSPAAMVSTASAFSPCREAAWRAVRRRRPHWPWCERRLAPFDPASVCTQAASRPESVTCMARLYRLLIVSMTSSGAGSWPGFVVGRFRGRDHSRLGRSLARPAGTAAPATALADDGAKRVEHRLGTCSRPSRTSSSVTHVSGFRRSAWLFSSSCFTGSGTRSEIRARISAWRARSRCTPSDPRRPCAGVGGPSSRASGASEAGS